MRQKELLTVVPFVLEAKLLTLHHFLNAIFVLVQEAGIPVDRLGGVSIGAFLGGLWGTTRDLTSATQRAREWFSLLGSPRWSGYLDVTYPHTSLFAGRYFNWTLRYAASTYIYG